MDTTTVDLLSTAVGAHAGEDLVLDLADVTFLASVGVQLLYELVTRDDVRLTAPAVVG